MKTEISALLGNLSAPSVEFIEAYRLISACKSWRRWRRPVSRAVYKRVCDDARNAARCFGVSETETLRFISHVIDHYIDHGTIASGFNLSEWQAAIFVILKRRIDEAVGRRRKAIMAAARRKERKTADENNEIRQNQSKTEGVPNMTQQHAEHSGQAVDIGAYNRFLMSAHRQCPVFDEKDLRRWDERRYWLR